MDIGSIHNYYQTLLANYLLNGALQGQESDQDFLEDVACLALNRLPARYVRHDVDMAFFLSTAERAKMEQEVAEAAEAAIAQVRHAKRND